MSTFVDAATSPDQEHQGMERLKVVHTSFASRTCQQLTTLGDAVPVYGA
jgi:hypothetical protein